MRDTIFMPINDPHLDSDFAKTIDNVHVAVVAAFCLWLLFQMIKAFVRIDVTEKYKAKMYIAMVILCLTVVLLGSVLKRMRVMEGSCIYFVVSFAIQNVFVLMMAYCHWPYEVMHDLYIEDAGENSHNN